MSIKEASDDTETKILFRAPKSLVLSIDAICKAENKTRAQKLRELIEEAIGNTTGVRPKPTFNYSAVSDQLENLRSKRNKLEKYLVENEICNEYNNSRPIFEIMYDFSITLEFSINPTLRESKEKDLNIYAEPHLSSLLKKLYKYAGQRHNDCFRSDNLEDWIKYLELTHGINGLRAKLNEYRIKMFDEKRIAFSFESTGEKTNETEKTCQRAS